MVGLVAVGQTITRVSGEMTRQLPLLIGTTVAALVLGALGSWLASRWLRRATHDPGPAELSRMYEYYDAVLHAVREGLLLVDREGRVRLVNDQARRLLALADEPAGRHVTELELSTELAELLAAGQGDVCFTCYADHVLSRARRGAPIDISRLEGIGLLTGTAVMKDAPHPYTAILWQRWAATEEGQQAYADAGRTPAHPNAVVREILRPERVHALGPDVVGNTRQYEPTWKQIFQLR